MSCFYEPSVPDSGVVCSIWEISSFSFSKILFSEPGTTGSHREQLLSFNLLLLELIFGLARPFDDFKTLQFLKQYSIPHVKTERESILKG